MIYSEVYNIRHLAFHFRRRLVFDCGFFSIQFEDFFKNCVEMKKKHEKRNMKNNELSNHIIVKKTAKKSLNQIRMAFLHAFLWKNGNFYSQGKK